jgi:hypothetical protein
MEGVLDNYWSNAAVGACPWVHMVGLCASEFRTSPLLVKQLILELWLWPWLLHLEATLCQKFLCAQST